MVRIDGDTLTLSSGLWCRLPTGATAVRPSECGIPALMRMPAESAVVLLGQRFAYISRHLTTGAGLRRALSDLMSPVGVR